jgi:hypothetical protein
LQAAGVLQQGFRDQFRERLLAAGSRLSALVGTVIAGSFGVVPTSRDQRLSTGTLMAGTRIRVIYLPDERIDR